MRKYFGVIIVILLVYLSGCTANLSRYKPFSDYVGKEVELKRPCVLEEYVTANNGVALSTYWDNDQPTELVYDDRLFTKPAKTVVNNYGQEQKLYPAADYPQRSFALCETQSWTGINRKNYGGAYRIYELPAGTNIFIEKASMYNRIDNISHSVIGSLVIPGNGKRVQFGYAFSDGPSAHGTMNDYISRAPWEDDSAPLERFIGWTGKGK